MAASEEEMLKERPLVPEPWVYKCQPWDHAELFQEWNTGPVTNHVPEELHVTLLGPEGISVPNVLVVAKREWLTIRAPTVPPRNVPYTHIRYVSTNCRGLCRNDDGDSINSSQSSDDGFVIMLSVRQPKDDDADIFNMYVRADSAKMTLDVMNFLRFHIFRYMKEVTEQSDPSVVLEYMRPVMVQQFEVQLHWRTEKKTFEEKRVVVLDQECIAFYKEPFQETPRDVMFFWKEQHNRTCAKIARIKSCDVIFMQSRTLYVVIPTRVQEVLATELQKALTDTIVPDAVPKKAFEDVVSMLQWLCGEYVGEKSPTAKANRDQQEQEEMESLLELDSTEWEKLSKWREEVCAGLVTPGEWQVVWTNVAPSLRKAMLNKTLPKVDTTHWDYDPNSVDSLLDAFMRIENELFNNVDYYKALSLTLATQRFFRESKVACYRRVAEDNAMDLLQEVFARGNVPHRVRVQTATAGDEGRSDDARGDREEAMDEFLSVDNFDDGMDSDEDEA